MTAKKPDKNKFINPSITMPANYLEALDIIGGDRGHSWAVRAAIRYLVKHSKEVKALLGPDFVLGMPPEDYPQAKTVEGESNGKD